MIVVSSLIRVSLFLYSIIFSYKNQLDRNLDNIIFPQIVYLLYYSTIKTADEILKYSNRLDVGFFKNKNFEAPFQKFLVYLTVTKAWVFIENSHWDVKPSFSDLVFQTPKVARYICQRQDLWAFCISGYNCPHDGFPRDNFSFGNS